MGKNESQEKEMKSNLSILKALREEELDNYKLITHEVKLDVSSITGKSLTDINALLRNYEDIYTVYRWIRRERDMGKPLPKTSEELHERVAMNPINIKSIFKDFNRIPKYSKKQMENYKSDAPRRRT